MTDRHPVDRLRELVGASLSNRNRESAPRHEDALIREQMEYYRVRAPEYDVTSAPPIDQLAAHARRIEVGLDQFRPTGRVLEIASGTGLWTIHLLRHASSITALDSSSEMHDLSRIKTVGDPRVHYVLADVFTWHPDGRYEVVFFADWLSHVPPGSFHRFWATVRAALAPAERVFFVDELDDAWKYGHPFRETFANDSSVPVVYRSVSDGRTFQVVKVYWNTEKLRSTLAAVG